MRSLTWAVVLCVGLLSAAHAVTIFTDNFDSGYSQWSASGDVSSSTAVVQSGQSVRLKNTGRIWKTISTVGYDSIVIVTSNLAASSLEAGTDACIAEYTTDGSSYTEILRLVNGQDTSTWYSSTPNIGLPAAAAQNPNFGFRYRDNGDAAGDYCYCETVTIAGSTGPPPPPPPLPPTSSFQDLTGTGVITPARSQITFAQLTGGSIPNPVDYSNFALPTNAKQATNFFSGPLVSVNAANVGSWLVVKDDFNYINAPERPHLPPINHEFLQHGSHFLPVIRKYTESSHPYWEYIFSPGRIWDESTDVFNGFQYSRVALPFAITQRNANCVHNGVMMFVFRSDPSTRQVLDISNVYYQISQETCAYFKVNLWGIVDVSMTSGGIANYATLRSDFEAEVNGRMPFFPISQLQTDFPGTVLSKYGAGITPAHMTAYGLIYNGKHYRGGYVTRHGNYPYPDVMVMPSYSTSKSWFTSLAAMRFSAKYPSVDIYNNFITPHIPGGECPSARWGDVKIIHALDMATGNYNLAGFEADEDSTGMENGYFLQETQSARLTYACSLPRKKTPGTFWNYHTTDNHIAATALQHAILVQEPSTGSIEKFMETEIYKPLGMSPVTFGPKRTYGAGAIAWGSYGEYALTDDIAKIGNFLNAGEGKIGGVQKLDYARLKMALQRDNANSGLAVSVPGSTLLHKYKHNYWAKAMYGGQYACSPGNEYTAYMSGYGGITVAMLKNKAVYYAVSDNFEYEWVDAALESFAHVATPCASYTP